MVSRTAIVLLPATLLIGGLIKNEEQRTWLPLAPVAACAELGTITFGGIPWLLFGWWGNDQPSIETDENINYSTKEDVTVNTSNQTARPDR